MKTCNCCLKNKPFSEFYKNRSKKDGYQGHCKVCSNVAAKKTYRTNLSSRLKTDLRNRDRKKYFRYLLSEIKRNVKCFFCKESEPVCLDFHHKDPNEKDFKPSSLNGQGMETIINELNKCVVICSNCHRKVHAGILPEPKAALAE